MLHVRGCHKQKYSEACRPILGKHTDGLAGTLIDLMAVFALLAGTTTTFTLATPLMSQIVSELFGFGDTRLITIAILAVTCLVYTVSVVRGMKGIQKLAASCVYLFFALLAYVLLFGGEARYIIETGFSSIGNAAMMDTVCRFAIELSLKMRTIGSRIRLRDQKVLIAMCGSSSLVRFL